MLEKKFKSKKEIKLFKDQYSAGDIDTEVISNMLQPYYQDKYPEMKDFMDWKCNNSLESRKMFALRMFSESNALDILKNKFGSCDFTFKGNRTYKNYVFDFEGLTFITPSKREVVLSEGSDWGKYIPKVIQFEKSFQQILMDAILSDFDNLPDYIKQDIVELKSKGLISQDNQINFDYLKPAKKMKP